MRLIELIFENENLPNDEGTEFGYKNTAEIRAAVFSFLQEKINKLNDKALKLGCPPIILTKEGEVYKDVGSGEEKVKELFYKVKVEGEAPRVHGYRFLATISHEAAGNVIKTVPGQDNNEKLKDFYDARPDYCDHCRKVRKRNDTYLIADKENNLRQIGRNCLADFLGGVDPKAIIFYFGLRDAVQDAIEESEERGVGVRGSYAASRDEVLNTAAALIKRYGFKKKPMDGESGWGTGQMVWWVLFGNKQGVLDDYEREVLDVARNVSNEDKQLTADALAWFNSLPEEEKTNNNFLHNLDVILKGDTISSKNVGIATALLPSYTRSLGMQKQKNEPQSNEWLGQVGSKITNVKVKVVDTRLITGQYGTTQLVTMRDESGNILKWFNSSRNDMENDKEYLIKSATIKSHETYNGKKQTLLKLVKT